MEKRKNFLFMENSLDWIRLFAALQVAISHYMNLSLLHYRKEGLEDTVLLYIKRVITLFPGVVILFCISGFLMAASLEKGADRISFAKKRFLRIYPGLWVNIVLTALLLTALLKPDRAGKKALLVWLGVQGTGIAYTPEFLKDFATGSINGTLWTIMVEIQFYLLIFLFWDFLKKRGDRFWHGALAVTFLLNLGSSFAVTRGLFPHAAEALLDRTALPYLFWFVFGMYLYRFGERIVPLLCKYLPFIGIFYILYKGCWQHFGWQIPGYYADFITSLVLPCLVTGCAYAFGKHRLKRDISYGIFLYHWPVINVIFYLGLPQKADHVLLLLCYIAAFCLLARASWELLEKRLVKR